jgi:RimJ/RimL family protein N-acetyltransferase
LGCARVTAPVEAKNLAARKFNEHIGFTQEAAMKGAASDGGDIILYVMRREDCRYVNSKQV